MGKIVVIEGPNGVGKSSIARRISRISDGKILSFPGSQSGTLGKLVKKIHKDSSAFGINEIADASLQTLHVAAHIDVINNQIKPLKNNGETIVLDRFWWSTVIYGGYYGVDDESLQAMVELEKIHWRGVQPDIVLLVDRPRPFTKETGNWSELRSSYLRFATEEEHPYPVEIVKNTSSIEDAVESVLDIIKRETAT